MNQDFSFRVEGVKETINALRKIDPQLQKDFKIQTTAIAQPAINAAKSAYKNVPLSGMKYRWRSEGRTRNNFPFTVAKAGAGVKVRFDTRRNSLGVILIEQRDPGAAIFETAGRANANKLNTSLMFVGLPVTAGRTRLIGPAVYKARRGIETQIKKIIDDAARIIQRELN